MILIHRATDGFFIASLDRLLVDNKPVRVGNSRLEAALTHCSDQLQGPAANPVELAFQACQA
jgi:hypothetical protein